MKTTNRAFILAANAAGLRHRNTDTYWMYETPVLQEAYSAGWERGYDLSTQPDVSGYRYGSIPEGGVSYNYREQMLERGLSLAAVDGGAPVGSVIFFADRPKYEVRGLLLPWTGSDGEPMVLPYGVRIDD
jgi:hypothetical protein